MLGHQSVGAECVTWSDELTPFNPRFKDIYRSIAAPRDAKDCGASRDLGLEQARHVFLGACGLLGEDPLWADQAHWSVLENGFGLGLNFLACYQAWSNDPKRPTHLHYCAIEAYPVSQEDLLKSSSAFSELNTLSEELQAQYWGLTPGFHRLTLGQGHVHLTLCIGDVQDLLPQIQGHFDSIFLDGFDPQKNPQMWSELTMRGIASRAKWGAIAATWSVSAQVKNNLAAAGFVCVKRAGLPPKREALKATYCPTWRDQMFEPRPSSRTPTSQNSPIFGQNANSDEVIIIGAGLAGASLAQSLAVRGIRVRVIDSQSGFELAAKRDNAFAPSTSTTSRLAPMNPRTPEQGAHGLPYGLFHPMNSRDDNMQSKMTRCGIRVLISTLERLKGLVEGDSYRICGVLEKKRMPPNKSTLPTSAKALGAANSSTSAPQDRRPDDQTLHDCWPTHWSRQPTNAECRVLMETELIDATDHSAPQNIKPKDALFHPKAGWIDVQALIHALLDHPLITCHAQEEVTHLVYQQPPVQGSEPMPNPLGEGHKKERPWHVQTRSNEATMHAHHYCASQVVLCTSVATQQLLHEHLQINADEKNQLLEEVKKTLASWPIQAIKGQLTLGLMEDLKTRGDEDLRLPSFAVNGQSSWVGGLRSSPSIKPQGEERISAGHDAGLFCIGASYERDLKEVVNSPAVRQSNIHKLSKLMPQVDLQTEARLVDWSGTRSTCQDRLPLVGPLHPRLPGLWIMSALGSRGLSMGMMLAEHLVSLITLEPSPLPKRLGQAIDPGRFLKNQSHITESN